VTNPGLEVQQSYHNAKIHIIIIKSLLCYIVKHLFYIPVVLAVWRRTVSQTGAFATGINLISGINRL
jgi:hypothetical protein